MVLVHGAVVAYGSVRIGAEEEVFQVDRRSLPVGDVLLLLQAVVAADHFVDGVEAEAGHDFPQVLGDEPHEVDDVFRLALKALAQLFVLRADAVGAGVEVAHAEHVAADGQERSCAEAEDFRAEQGGDGDVPAGEHLAVDFDLYAVAQLVEEQGLLHFGQADFPGQAGVAQAGPRRRARAAVVAADDDVVGLGLDDAGRDGADAGSRRELDADAGFGIDVFKVEDELSQVFDGVDVVVGRRRNEGDARRGVTRLGDIRVDLAARQVAAFARLCALGAFDLQLVGVDEVVARHAEAGRGDLLDFVVRFCAEPGCVFAAFAGVAHAAEAVHGRGDAFVGFLAECAVAHGAGAEPLDDGVDRFDFFDGNAAAGGIFEFQKVAEAEDGRRIDPLGIFLIDIVILFLAGLLQQADRFGVDDMRLAALVVLVEIAPFQRVVGAVGRFVAQGVFPGDFRDADAFDARRRVAEILIDQVLLDTDGFENLRAVVAVDRRNAHLGHDGQDALDGGVHVVVAGLFISHLAQLAFENQFLDGFEGDVGVDGRDAVADERAEVVDFPRFARFEDEADVGADRLVDEVVVQCCRGQEGRNGGHAGVDAPVGQDEDIGTVLYGFQGVDAQGFDGRFHAFGTAVDRIEHG